MGCPKIRGTILGAPIIRAIVYSVFGSILGSPYSGKLPYLFYRKTLNLDQ